MRFVDARLPISVFGIPQPLEHPPHRLHEIAVHGFVVVIEVDPAAHARDGFAPLGDVGLHHRAALFIELIDAERADLGRAVEVQCFLREVFDRQAVAVPAEAAVDVFAAHVPITRHDVFDGASQ